MLFSDENVKMELMQFVGKATFLLINGSACLKLQNVAGYSG
jgi:hypothetical protein